MITRIAQSVLPYPYNYGAEVLADAIQVAAHQRTRSERFEALAIGTGIAALAVILLRS